LAGLILKVQRGYAYFVVEQVKIERFSLLGEGQSISNIAVQTKEV
jgi:hypothetical protein